MHGHNDLEIVIRNVIMKYIENGRRMDQITVLSRIIKQKSTPWRPSMSLCHC